MLLPLFSSKADRPLADFVTVVPAEPHPTHPDLRESHGASRHTLFIRLTLQIRGEVICRSITGRLSACRSFATAITNISVVARNWNSQ